MYLSLISCGAALKKISLFITDLVLYSTEKNKFIYHGSVVVQYWNIISLIIKDLVLSSTDKNKFIYHGSGVVQYWNKLSLFITDLVLCPPK